jgi:hypothetical protein
MCWRLRFRPLLLPAAAAALVAAAACGSSSATSPLGVAPGPAPTVYVGSIQDSASGAGTLRLTLSTVQGVVGGTWTATFNGRSEPTLVITGVPQNDQLTATIHPEVTDTSGSSGCTLSMTATIAASQISGTYASFAVTPTCPAARTGTFAATRQ